MKTTGGYTLLEALLAIAFAGLFFLGAFGLFFTAHRSSAEAVRRQEALWVAQQGIEALKTMAFEDLVPTQTGRVTFASNRWTLSSSGSELLSNGMTRTIRVEDAYRDTECGLVESGGEVDTDSMYLESQVTWNDLQGREQEILLRSLRTNWANPNDTCFASDCSQLDWDVYGASWFGGKQLREVYITNNTGEDKEIDKITLYWDKATLLQQVFFSGSKFWSSSGPGTPSGYQTSGTILDGANGVIEDGETVEMHKTQFDKNMMGANISVTYTCTDGSAVTFGPFTPSY